MSAKTASAKVRLRPVIDTDVPVFLANHNDPVAAAMAIYPTQEAAPFFAHWVQIRAEPTGITRTVVLGREVVGYMLGWRNKGGEHEVGYWIGRPFWGRGYATAALRLLIDELPDRPLIAHVALDNIGSRRVLEHCGFVMVGEADAHDGVREYTLRLE